MAYSSNSATGPIDCLQKLVTWLVTQGWTNNYSASEGAGWRAHLSKGAIYVNLRALVGEGHQFHRSGGSGSYGIDMYTGTGYASGSAWRDQPGGPTEAGTAYTLGVSMPMPAGAIPSYHFFADDADNITVVTEYSAGDYRHMGWGTLTKSGAYTGGAFIFASGVTMCGCLDTLAYPVPIAQHSGTSPLASSEPMWIPLLGNGWA